MRADHLARIAVVGALLFMCAGASGSARADEVPAAPFCERGLRGESSHGGPYCALDACDLGRTCTDGRTCVPRSFCIVPRTGETRGGPFIDETVTNECTTDADCGGIGTCRSADVCMDVDAHRRRGLVILTVGLGAFALVAALAVYLSRGRRRARPRA